MLHQVRYLHTIQILKCCIFFSCWIRIQVRYGQHWAPVHPYEPVTGSLTEILLTSDEVFIQLKARSSAVIDFIQFASNLKSYLPLGTFDSNANVLPLDGLLYFSGAAGNYGGVRVTNLVAHRGTC